jgi:arylsulfatase A-like enzyme
MGMNNRELRDTGKGLGAWQILAVAASLALITAFGELTLLAALKFVLHRRLHLGPSVVWMTPIALLVIFAVPGLLFVVASRFWRRLADPGVVVTSLVFLMMLNWILVERIISIWALLILSVGVAIQAGRLARAHRQSFQRLLRIATPALAALVIVATIAVEGGLALSRSRAEHRLPPARDGAANVLFIILDTVRARTLSLYGYERETTPNLERLAARGVVFDRATSPGTWTVPSHGSMFTGKWPFQIGSWWSSPERLPPGTTLAGFMAEHGYRTAGFIGNWYHIGKESGLSSGFGYYDDLGRSPAQIARGSAMIRWLSQRRTVRRIIGLYETLGRRRAPDVSRSFLAWVDNGSERPWFAFLNYFDAHSPFLPPPPFDARFGTSVSYREPVVIEELNMEVDPTPEVVQAELDAYDGGMAYLDAEIGLLFDALDARGELENTIVIIGSDHGEELGEHGRWGHAYSTYAEIVHVPLLVLAPDAPAATRIATPVSLRNIPATIADMAKLDGAPFPGVSLATHWRALDGGPVVTDTALSIFGKYRSLYDEQYHYLTGVFDDREHLYDHRVDPLDVNDLAQTPEAAPILERFRRDVAAVAPASNRQTDVGTPAIR